MSPKSLRSGFLFLLFLLQVTLFAQQAVTQSIGGTFFGIVKDPTGPVPQAEVRITNLATGQGRFVFTDDQGRYELREVPPGLYELKVSKDGYNTVLTPPSQGLELGLAQVSRVNDITLNVAPVGTTTVEVNALNLLMTDSERPTLSTAFGERQIRELPLSGRDLNNLAPLAPGVVSVSSFSFANTLVPFSVNGSRGRDNNFIIDSVDNNEPLFGGAATQFSNSEIFSEFRILTGQFQAEYGRNSGSIVNVVTKQGGKQLHGSLFWYGQNDGLNAMTKIEKESQLTKPARFYDNQLGASVGGPIKKESTWYFASYQWERTRNDLSQEYPVVVTLPTAEGLGVLQGIHSSNPTPTLAAFLADPTVSTLPFSLNGPCGSFLNAKLNSTLHDTNPCTTGTATWVPPNIKREDCGNTPPPSPPCVDIPFGTYLVPRANVFDFRDHQGSARIDQKLGERENFFFRYLLDDLRTPLGLISDPSHVAFSDLGLLPQWRNILAQRTQNFGSSWAHAFDRALNELRLSYSRISSQRGALDADPKARELPEMTVSDIRSSCFLIFCSGRFAPESIPGFPAAGSFMSLGSDSRPARVRSNLVQLQENFTSIRGVHSLKFGGNFLETRSYLRQINGDLGHYFYGTFSDFVNNITDSGYERFGNLGGKGGEVLPLREFAQFYFAEDDIKLSPHFTLNLGIRYENYGQAYNRVLNQSAANLESPPHLGRVSTNIAPRLGFAWGPGKNLVLRGGYGIYYDPMFFNIALLSWQSGSISPYVFSGVACSTKADASGQCNGNTTPPPILELSNQFPNPPFNTGDAASQFITAVQALLGQPISHSSDCEGINPAPNPLPTGAAPLTFLDCTNQNTVSVNLRNPFVHNVSLSMQHQLKRDVLLELSYLGSRGTKLFQRRDLNPHGGWSIASTSPPCLQTPCAILRPRLQPHRGSIIEMSNGAYSNYHGLQFSGTKRFRGEGLWNGIALTGAYTWSHMTDNASEVFGPGVQSTGLGQAVGQNGKLGFLGLFDLTEPFETSTPLPQDFSNPRNGERGNSSFDHRHRFSLSFAWAFPSFGPKVARTMFGNWELNGVVTAQSGQPFTPINSTIATPGGLPNLFNTNAASLGTTLPFGCGDVSGDGIAFNDRPSIGNPNAPAKTVALLNNIYCLDPNSSDPNVAMLATMNPIVAGMGPYITPDGHSVDPKTVRFVQVPIGCIRSANKPCGDAGRNILTGPATVNVDLSLSKSFRFRERFQLQLRGDAYDLLNRANPGPFAGNPYSASAQQVAAVAYYPTIGIGAQPAVGGQPLTSSTSSTLARVSGTTPENSIDATDTSTGKSLFLSRKFLTTSSRRLQLSLRITF
jgi:carboxypeptidase family protein/TonB-dependent receptor-like protein